MSEAANTGNACVGGPAALSNARLTVSLGTLGLNGKEATARLVDAGCSTSDEQFLKPRFAAIWSWACASGMPVCRDSRLALGRSWSSGA